MEQPHPIRRISFSVRVQTHSFEDPLNRENFYLPSRDPADTTPMSLVSMYIDGIEPVRSTFEQPLKTVELLTAHERPGKQSLYACRCSNRYCCFFYEFVYLTMDAHTVQLRYPSTTYTPLLAPEFKPAAGADFVAVFDKAQYLAALSELEQELIALNQTHLRMQDASNAVSTDMPGLFSFPQILSNTRNFIKAKAYCKAFTQETLGVFADQDIRITAPEGEFLLSAFHWQMQFTNSRQNVPFNETQKEALREAAQRLNQPGMTCTQFFLALDWCHSRGRAWHLRKKPREEERRYLVEEPSAEYLSQVSATWVSSE